MRELVLYIHGRGGSAGESQHYVPLFPGCRVQGLDYRSHTPWEAGPELRAAVKALGESEESITLIANSIGAYFSMAAGIDGLIRRAFFISPVVDMEGLILGRMGAWGVTEAELRARGVVEVPEGEPLSWDWLRWVREHPLRWEAPTAILYGGRDALTPRETVEAFAGRIHARLCVMEEGEHWFHTPGQLRFLDDWLRRERDL